MSRHGRIYIISVLSAGILLSGITFCYSTSAPGDWGAFALLTIAVTLSQWHKTIFKSQPHSERGTVSYSPMLIFLVAGVLLLAPFQYLLLVIIPHLLEWAKEYYQKSKVLQPAYAQPINIATHILCGLGAQQAYQAMNLLLSGLPLSYLVLPLAGVVVVYPVLNYLLIGGTLVIAQGLALKETHLLDPDGWVPDVMMVCLGCVVALLWELNPWLSLLALSPLGMIQRALAVPQLKQQARIDGKTGLWNARHFADLFKAEFERSKRFHRPLAVILCDLDLLRNINNTYGHLAGDAVLAEVGQIIRSSVRAYDIPARFGGEEFVIAMPESDLGEAATLAERIRATVESAEFRTKTTPEPIRVTISLGTASFPGDAATMIDLIHAADIAVYQAKLQGRNCHISYSNLPPSPDLEIAAAEDRLASRLDSTDAYAFARTRLSRPATPCF